MSYSQARLHEGDRIGGLRLRTNGKLARQFEVTRDLLRAPPLLEQPYHQTEIPTAKLLVSARPGSPGAAGCLARAVVVIVRGDLWIVHGEVPDLGG